MPDNPANLTADVTGDTATLEWDAATGLTTPAYSVFRRSPQTGAAFDPDSDTPIVSDLADETYDDAGLADGAYDWQVFATEGAVAFDPSQVPGVLGWWDASDTGSITESGGFASQLDDLTGGGNHFVQATGSAQPATGSRTVNSLNVLDFDGAGDWMSTTTALDLTAPFTLWMVVTTDSSSWQALLTPSDGNYVEFEVTSGTVQVSFGATFESSNGATIGTTYAIGIVVNGASSKIVFDGTTTNGNAGSGTLNNLQFGRYATGTDWFNGALSEAAVYSGDQSASFTDLTTYAASKWGAS